MSKVYELYVSILYGYYRIITWIECM